MKKSKEGIESEHYHESFSSTNLFVEMRKKGNSCKLRHPVDYSTDEDVRKEFSEEKSWSIEQKHGDKESHAEF